MLGKTGLVGSYFLDQFIGLIGFNLHAPTKEEFDILDFDSVGKYFKHISPEIVINCTGYTAVDDAETHREEAFNLNAEAVGNLATVCKENGAILIHFSTDYVFDGKNPNGYEEDATTNPINIYSESKLEGEKLVAANMSDYYIIRTSWLYGVNAKNFVNTMMELAKKTKDELNVVGDQIGAPTNANELVTTVIQNFIEKRNLPFGIYHITNSGKCSWCEFAKEIFRIAGLNVKVNKVSSDQFPRPAKRPGSSILLNTKLGHEMRPWQEALKVYMDLNF